jgi:hypothetical protein
LTIIHQDNGESLLTGRLADQAALHGVLTRLWEAGIPLIAVNQVEGTQADDSQTTQLE